MKKTFVLILVLIASLLAYFFVTPKVPQKPYVGAKPPESNQRKQDPPTTDNSPIYDEIKPRIVESSENPLRLKQGATATLFVLTRGGGPNSPIIYQWDFQPKASQNWTPLARVNGDTLKIDSVSRTNEGRYRATAKVVLQSNLTFKAETNLTVELLPVEAPTITRQPLPVQSKIGQNAEFTSELRGDLPISVRWQFQTIKEDGPWSDIQVGEFTQLQLKNLTLEQNGRLRLVARNDGGAVTSSPVALVVKPLDSPVIKVQSLEFEGYPSERITLKTILAGDAPIHCEWQNRGAESAFWQTIESANEPTLVLPALRFADQGQYRLIASNPSGAATSQVFTVKVLRPKLGIQVRYTGPQFEPGYGTVNGTEDALTTIEAQLRELHTVEVFDRTAPSTQRGYEMLMLEIKALSGNFRAERHSKKLIIIDVNINGVTFTPKGSVQLTWHLRQGAKQLEEGRATGEAQGTDFTLPFKGKTRNGFIEPSEADASRHMLQNHLLPSSAACQRAAAELVGRISPNIQKLSTQKP